MTIDRSEETEEGRMLQIALGWDAWEKKKNGQMPWR